MSFSKPVILSDIDPHKEIASYDVSSAILFSVNNPEETKKAMKKLLNMHPDEIDKMGKAAKNIVLENFEWENVVDKTEKVYLENFNR